jgi:hypothetical protein
MSILIVGFADIDRYLFPSAMNAGCNFHESINIAHRANINKYQ